MSKILFDIATLTTEDKKIHQAICKNYIYNQTAKLAKGEFYKFLSSIDVPEKQHRDVMNRLVKADSMNSRSIIGLMTNAPPLLKVAVVDSEAETEEVETEETEEVEEDEEEEEEKIDLRKLGKSIRVHTLQGCSLSHAFLLSRASIDILRTYTKEDLRDMETADLEVIIHILRCTHTAMWRAAKKYFPHREFKRE